ncbi:MAG TPA: CoA transferase [Candidatus Limnocylindria bacterium]|nr:CoA transferase [Candidatus Limnocylindria bacterium]
MAGRAPLAGIRVADFTWVWAGPFCTLQLAHLGAEVIRVETATRPCVTRLLPPFADFEPGLDRSGYFNQYNQGKKSIALDLKRPEAIEAARRLCAASDVVVENFAAGVMERLGLGWDVLRELRPDLVMIALSGYGATGPDADKVSYGPAQVPLSGMSSVTGYRGFPPMHVGISYGDPTGGLHGAVAVLAALLHRARTGEGQYIDLSQWETSMAVLPEAICAWTMNGVAPERNGNRDRYMAPHGIFRAAGDDRWVAIAVEDEAAWARFVAAIGRPELTSDPRWATAAARKENEDALEEIVTAWTSTRSPEEATATLQSAGVAAFTAATNRDLAEDPHLNARGFFVELPHPAVGARKHIGVPWRMSASDCRVRRVAPCLGADTDQVLRDVCGYSEAEIARLRDAQALV